MDGTTGIVLAVIGALVTLVLGILNYVNKKNECDTNKIVKQTELEGKLINIEKELVEIKALLVSSNEKYEILCKIQNDLDKRVLMLENKKTRAK